MMITILENPSITSPLGFKSSAIRAGIYEHKYDLGLIVADQPCNAAAVYTKNAVVADTIPITRSNLQNGVAQGIIVNSGNANACAINGTENAKAVLEAISKETGINSTDFIINSTGVVGVELPKDKIISAIPSLVSKLSTESSDDIAQAIMTTDTFSKSRAIQTEIGGKTITIAAVAKGSGMIHPNMATMLCFITTDLSISSPMLQKALSHSVDKTYNRITVDGDTSTNDMVAILASGLAKNEQITEESSDYHMFLEALNVVNLYLAQLIARDGEGATHFVSVNVKNVNTEQEATQLAKSVAGSSLVKTALFGSDANWGRVLVALGYSGVEFDKSKVSVEFSSIAGDIKVCSGGMGIAFDESLAKSILKEKDIYINIDMGQGEKFSYAFGCDLTYDYVKINGDYRS